MFGWFAGLFVNLPFLLGTAAAAIPIVIHLAHRRRAPRVPFTTLRFIRASAERTARRRRIEEWLLLLLRTAAIFLLAIALAGPIIRAARGGGGKNTAIVLVMDNSFSMGAEFEGRSRSLHRAEPLTRHSPPTGTDWPTRSRSAASRWCPAIWPGQWRARRKYSRPRRSAIARSTCWATSRRRRGVH